MGEAQKLRERADQADRLARNSIDNITIERLTSYSTEMRTLADRIENAHGLDPVAV